MKRPLLLLLLTLFGAQLVTAQTPSGSTDNPQSTTSGAGASSGDSTKLLVSNYVRPTYPDEAKAKGLEGTVQVHLDIDEEGNVVKAEATSGDEVFKTPAVEAFKQWKFKPYIKGGHAVRVSTTLPMNFILPPPQPSDMATQSSGQTAVPGNANAAALTQSDKPTVITVSKMVSEGLLIHQVKPEYPPLARFSHRQGSVILRAVIGKDGFIKSLRMVAGDKVFEEAAVTAVKQWKYRPYLLAGKPVEVDTQITVNFVLPPPKPSFTR